MNDVSYFRNAIEAPTPKHRHHWMIAKCSHDKSLKVEWVWVCVCVRMQVVGEMKYTQINWMRALTLKASQQTLCAMQWQIKANARKNPSGNWEHFLFAAFVYFFLFMCRCLFFYYLYVVASLSALSACTWVCVCVCVCKTLCDCNRCFHPIHFFSLLSSAALTVFYSA